MANKITMKALTNSALKLQVTRQKYGKNISRAPGAISRPFSRLLQITIISFSFQLAANAAPTFLFVLLILSTLVLFT